MGRNKECHERSKRSETTLFLIGHRFEIEVVHYTLFLISIASNTGTTYVVKVSCSARLYLSILFRMVFLYFPAPLTAPSPCDIGREPPVCGCYLAHRPPRPVDDEGVANRKK